MKLSTQEIAFLARAFPTQTVLGPFSNISQVPDGTEENSLAQKGILEEGQLTAEARAMLEVAAKAQTCTRLMVKNSFLTLEKYTYRDGDSLILAENDRGELIFSDPPDLTGEMLEIAELIGMSKLKTADIEVLAGSDEIMTLLGLTDLYRSSALRMYAGQEIPDTEISLTGIQKQLAEPASNSLVQFMIKNTAYTGPVAEAVGDVLQKLIDRDCVSLQQGGYGLVGEYALFAKSFLIPETVLLVESFHLDSAGGIQVAGALGLSAGVNDLAMLLFDGAQIELSSVSAFQMLRMVENFMLCPNTGNGQTADPPARFCTQCGAGITPAAIFCTNCGVKLS